MADSRNEDALLICIIRLKSLLNIGDLMGYLDLISCIKRAVTGELKIFCYFLLLS
jgi:hypothetical protein